MLRINRCPVSQSYGCAEIKNFSTPLAVSVAALIFLATITYQVVQADGRTGIRQTTLSSNDGEAGDAFGTGVGLDDNTLVVGARLDTHSGLTWAGSAYVFERSKGLWSPPQKLIASDAEFQGQFGRTVAIDREIIVVAAAGSRGEPGSDQAYVFVPDGPTWVQAAILTAGDHARTDTFGESVGVSAGTVVVGSPFHDHFGSDDGGAYVYARNSDEWSQVAELNALNPTSGDHFGRGVAIDDNTIVVGAERAGSKGAVYVFEFDGDEWYQKQILTASDGSSGDEFGGTPAVSNGVIVVSARKHAPGGLSQAGAAYVFEYDSDTDTWAETAELTASDAASGDQFSVGGVATDGDTIVVGSQLDGHEFGTPPGAIYVYIRQDGTWVQDKKVTATDPNLFGFGRGVSVEGDTIISSSNDFDAVGSAVVLFADLDADDLGDDAEESAGTDPTDPDSDDDGLTDGEEVNTYGTLALIADTDGDGLSDGTEVALQEFGCPSPLLADTDDDGITDGTEVGLGLDACDSLADFDDDGLTDSLELLIYGTDPLDADSDHDGLLDGTEVEIAEGGSCPDPLTGDSDGDTLVDGAEIDLGTDPCNSDTDGDGVGDSEDPTPTDRGVPANFIEEGLRDLGDYIGVLDLGDFEAPNANAGRGRQNSFQNKLRTAANDIRDGQIQEAIDQLVSVLLKVDGDPTPPDWMVDPQRSIVREEVEFWIELLALLI